jgi:3-oxoacyl-[acyl-carrier protein] reductase
MNNSDRTVIITGGAKGIGASTAMLFAERGTKTIIIADVIDKKAKETCNLIRKKTSCEAAYKYTDISCENSVHELFKYVRERFGGVDVLINCAGICSQESIEEMDGNKFDKAIDINLRGTYLCSREAFVDMKTKKYGKIINFTSVSGQIGGIATAPSYAASKGGVISLTLSFAKAAAPFNVNVNAVAPGLIDTDMAMSHFTPQMVPLNRIGTPRDVASVVWFLASEDSSYMTGTILSVNGGMFMYSI